LTIFVFHFLTLGGLSPISEQLAICNTVDLLENINIIADQ